LQELLEDIARRENTRRLAKIADERWATLGSGSVERLALKDSDEAVKGSFLRAIADFSGSRENGGKRRRPRKSNKGITRSRSWSDIPTQSMVRENYY